MRGATAGQAIATSGTTILGWSNNRVRQLVSSALPAMTQSDIDNATTGRKSVTGALIASNAGGGTELTQAQVEDEPTRRLAASPASGWLRRWPCSHPPQPPLTALCLPMPWGEQHGRPA